MSKESGYITRREAVYKQLRARAHKEQTTFRFCRLDLPANTPPQLVAERYYSCHKDTEDNERKETPRSGRVNNIPRGGEHMVSGVHRIKPRAPEQNLDIVGVLEEEKDDNDWSEETVAPPMTFSFEDVPIRVAKPKGIKKEYEVIDKVKPVLALEDFELEHDVYYDDWEDLEGLAIAISASYATAVKSGGG